jgi:hypothetical protein
MGKFLWLIPPLLGGMSFAVFRSLGPREPVAEAGSPESSRLEAPANRTADVESLLEEFEATWKEVQHAESLSVLGLDSAALRSRLLETKKKFDGLPEDTDWDVHDRMTTQLISMARELGKRQRAEAFEWILKECPDLRLATMSGWAESDPDSAFDAVISSGRELPCDTPTLMRLLDHQADQGGQALLEACRKVPWEMLYYERSGFLGGDDPFGPAMELPEGADVAAWINSGSLTELASLGVNINNVFATWAKQDPAEALAHWETMPNLHPLTPSRRIAQILQPGTENPEILKKTYQALLALPPEEIQKVSAELVNFRDLGLSPDYAVKLAELYPMLKPSPAE